MSFSYDSQSQEKMTHMPTDRDLKQRSQSLPSLWIPSQRKSSGGRKATETYTDQQPSQKTHLSKNRVRNFQRQRFHLQDHSWSDTGSEFAKDTDLQAITETLDYLSIKTKLGRKVLSAPRSSNRFDWFYKSPEREKRRQLQKHRLRHAQGKKFEQTSRISKKNPSSEEGNDERMSDVLEEGSLEIEEYDQEDDTNRRQPSE